MTDKSQSSNTLVSLAALVQKTERDRDQMGIMLNEFRKVHLKTRTERDAALKELASTKSALEKSQADNARLTKRNGELDQQVSVMAAAVEAANSKISEADSMLLDSVLSVKADFFIEPENKPASPVLTINPQTNVAKVQEPLRPEVLSASPAQRTPVVSLLQDRPSDNLDASMLEIEKLLNESLDGTLPQ